MKVRLARIELGAFLFGPRGVEQPAGIIHGQEPAGAGGGAGADAQVGLRELRAGLRGRLRRAARRFRAAAAHEQGSRTDEPGDTGHLRRIARSRFETPLGGPGARAAATVRCGAMSRQGQVGQVGQVRSGRAGGPGGWSGRPGRSDGDDARAAVGRRQRPRAGHGVRPRLPGRACSIAMSMRSSPTHRPGWRWPRGVKFTENGQRLEPGDGAWRTVTARGGYGLKIADVERGQAVLMGTIREADTPAMFVLRLPASPASRLPKLETLVMRNQMAAENLDCVAAAARGVVGSGATRQPGCRAPSWSGSRTCISPASSATTARGTGIRSSKACARLENGVGHGGRSGSWSSARRRGERLADVADAARAVSEQFQSGVFFYVTRIRDRRFVARRSRARPRLRVCVLRQRLRRYAERDAGRRPQGRIRSERAVDLADRRGVQDRKRRRSDRLNRSCIRCLYARAPAGARGSSRCPANHKRSGRPGRAGGPGRESGGSRPCLPPHLAT